MSNVLRAIANIADFHKNDLRNYATTYLNRINAAGEQLEFYIKDSLVGSFSKKQNQKEREYQKVFAYLGNQNNPPDVIIKEGDAFEIKKMEGLASSLALNSSYPKDRLHADDPRITAKCRECDRGRWSEKDIFYVVGHVKGGLIRHLFFVQGSCYAADKAVYERIHSPLKQEITKIIKMQGIQGSSTVELGKVKKVDPLGITDLRIRGMWDIQNPVRVFQYVYPVDREKIFSLCLILKEDKFNSFLARDIELLEKKPGVSIKSILIKDPNNPARNISAKIITLSW